MKIKTSALPSLNSLICLAVFLSAVLVWGSCKKGPRVIESESGTGLLDPNQGEQSNQTQAMPESHTVVVKEALNTSKYTYLRVTENDQEFWIAVPKTAVKIGGTYSYQGGLMKKNFQSREYNRTFETLYLVSGISEQPTGGETPSLRGMSEDMASQVPQEQAPIQNIQPAKGAVRIADLLANPGKYKDKTILVSGQVIKINPMIMNRNWVHMEDGSSKDFDLTVTTLENVSVGAVVTFSGRISLNKDFGAGYKYNVIMEDAELR